MKVRILRSAVEDLADGRIFYERQEQGVGDYFLDNLFADIDSLAIYAGIHEVKFGFYRQLAKRFPYSIYYKIISNEAMVFHILDCRCGPNWIYKTLSGKTPLD
ncbi:type II toxin-antitoxin system RelE/ParE family toxin [Methylomagnum sp.]